MWKWFNYVSKAAPPRKQILRLNLDETSVCLFQGNGRGNVFVAKRRAVQQVSRRKRRCCLTHVATICDNSGLQPLLPQVIIGNAVAFPARRMVALRALCPPNVTLVRQKSAWVNAELFANIVHLIALAIRAWTYRFQPVLIMDTCRVHITQTVLCACYRHGIWVVLVPSLTTWVLNPLDTHGFNKYKAQLQDEYQAARIAAEGNEVDIEDFLRCIFRVIRNILQGKRWSNAFDDNGFSLGQTSTSSTLRAQFGSRFPCDVSCERPSGEDIARCFPRRAVVHTALLMKPFEIETSREQAEISTAASSAEFAVPRGRPLVPHRIVYRAAALALSQRRAT